MGRWGGLDAAACMQHVSHGIVCTPAHPHADDVAPMSEAELSSPSTSRSFSPQSSCPSSPARSSLCASARGSPIRNSACETDVRPRNLTTPDQEPIQVADVEGGGYSGVVRLRMCDPRGAVSRIIAMDGWMEQQLEGERDAAVARAEKAETGWKASRAELDLSRKTARKEREALEAKLREERRKDHLAIRTVRLAVHEAQEQCAHLGQRLKTTGWQYTCERKKVLRLEKQLAKVKEEFSDLQAEHVASKRSNVDAHSLLNRRDVAVIYEAAVPGGIR